MNISPAGLIPLFAKLAFFHFWYVILVPVLAVLFRNKLDKKMNFILAGLLVCFAIDLVFPVLFWRLIPQTQGNAILVKAVCILLGLIAVLLLAVHYEAKTTPSSQTNAGSEDRIPAVMAGLSYIPLFGILFGFIVIVWGLVTKREGAKKTAFIGMGGIAFSFVLYGSLFYFGFMERGGVYDRLRQQMAKNMLGSLVHSIEFYKLQHGSYPANLEELEKSPDKNEFIAIYDPTRVSSLGEKPETFYYRPLDDGSGYYLLGVGQDGRAFTYDDILPPIENTENIGLRFSTEEQRRADERHREELLQAEYINPELKGKPAGELHALGLDLFNKKEYAHAAAVWLVEAEKDPKNPNTLNNVGIAFKYAGDYDRALLYSGKAIELDPRFGHAYMSLGRAYLEMKRYREARTYLLKAVENNWADADTYFNLGLASRYLNDRDAALAYFQKVKAMSPNYPTIDEYLR